MSRQDASTFRGVYFFRIFNVIGTRGACIYMHYEAIEMQNIFYHQGGRICMIYIVKK